jgi:hypothetical protein
MFGMTYSKWKSNPLQSNFGMPNQFSGLPSEVRPARPWSYLFYYEKQDMAMLLAGVQWSCCLKFVAVDLFFQADVRNDTLVVS